MSNSRQIGLGRIETTKVDFTGNEIAENVFFDE